MEQVQIQAHFSNEMENHSMMFTPERGLGQRAGPQILNKAYFW